MTHKLRQFCEVESGAEVYYLGHAYRLNGVIDVWKNGKTVYCKPENDYKNFNTEDEIIEYAKQKLSQYGRTNPIKKLGSGKMSMQEFRNNKLQEKYKGEYSDDNQIKPKK